MPKAGRTGENSRRLEVFGDCPEFVDNFFKLVAMLDFSEMIAQGAGNAWFFIPSAILLGDGLVCRRG